MLVINKPENQEEIKKESHKKGNTIVAILGIVAVLVVLLIVILFNTKPQNQTSEESIPANMQTTLDLSLNPSIISSNSANILYSEDANISTGENKVNAIQLEFSFDPTKINVVDIKPTDFISKPQVLFKNIDNKNGIISLSIVVPLGNNGVSGKGAIATILFNEVKGQTGQTAINFTQKTDVLAQGVNHSVLKSTTSTLFNLNQ